MYKVFFYDRIIFLTDQLPKAGENIYIYTDDKWLSDKLSEFERNPQIKSITLFSPDLKKLEQSFFQQFIYVEAAGGVVKNIDGDLLFIHRLGKWDLPKGKVETGEKIEEAAVREVEEECGIDKLKIIKQLPSTFHTFYAGNTRFLKQTYWFEMTHNGKDKLTPQTEEDITDARWIAQNNLEMIKENTFLSILDLMEYM